MDEGNTDKIAKLATKQAEWRALPISDKVDLLKELVEIWTALSMDKIVDMQGNPETQSRGFSTDSDEGKSEAMLAAFYYTLVVKTFVEKLLEVYEAAAASGPSDDKKSKALLKLPVKNAAHDGRRIVQTFPVTANEKQGPLAKCQAEMWLAPPEKNEEKEQDASGSTISIGLNEESLLLLSSDNDCMLVLGAGNHCFLPTVDCLYGLFERNSVVFLKHHPTRGHHDPFFRHLMKPLLDRGFVDCELDISLDRTKELVYHTSVTRTHLTGGKATHDAIVWGKQAKLEQKSQPLLQNATMTSELGCITPWIVVPQHFSNRQLDHQIKHLFFALFNNAGANCNSPKLIVLTKNWEHSQEFVDKLKKILKDNPVPVAFYPGSRDRWEKHHQAYRNTAETLGDASDEARQKRQLQAKATLLPWLLVELQDVDLTSDEGQNRAANEYAFQNEPFAPVVSIAYVEDLETGVKLCNDYVYGTLSCTLVAPDFETPQVQTAITELKYGCIALNTWSAMSYANVGCKWGAFPGETLDAVQSGIGCVQNYYFLPNVEKSVMYVDVVDPNINGVKPSSIKAECAQYRATGNLLLKPGLFRLLNLIAVMVFGAEIPPYCWSES